MNSDKLIDYNEFLTAACDRISQLSEKNLKIAFHALDENQDGFLSMEELKAGFAGY